MSKKKLLSVLIISLAVLFTSCNQIITSPNPLIGCYRVSQTSGSKAGLFYYFLEDNGYFVLYQAGGANSNEFIKFEGVWYYTLNHFDFIDANGSLTLKVTQTDNANNASGLALSYGEDNDENEFEFSWHLDTATGITSLILHSENPDICNIPETGFSINVQEFERATGSDLYPDEEVPETPEEPGTDEPGENPETPENPDEETPEEPDTEEPSTDPDTEEPGTDTEDPDGDGSEEVNPDDGEGSEDQEGEGNDDTTNPSEPPETEPSEDTDTDIVA